MGRTTTQRRSGMARVVKGSHSFTFHSFMRLSANGMNHTWFCLPSRSWSSFTDPGGMKGWVGLGTTMVSKQSAQNRPVTEITAISCSDRHASLGNWKYSRLWASNSRPFVQKAATLITETPSNPNNRRFSLIICYKIRLEEQSITLRLKLQRP